MVHISHKDFETLDWLPITERLNQHINSTVFKYFNDHSTKYLKELFKTAPQSNFQTRSSLQKLKCSFCKTNISKNVLSYIASTHGAKLQIRLSEQTISTKETSKET